MYIWFWPTLDKGDRTRIIAPSTANWELVGDHETCGKGGGVGNLDKQINTFPHPADALVDLVLHAAWLRVVVKVVHGVYVRVVLHVAHHLRADGLVVRDGEALS